MKLQDTNAYVKKASWLDSFNTHSNRNTNSYDWYAYNKSKKKYKIALNKKKPFSQQILRTTLLIVEL